MCDPPPQGTEGTRVSTGHTRLTCLIMFCLGCITAAGHTLSLCAAANNADSCEHVQHVPRCPLRPWGLGAGHYEHMSLPTQVTEESSQVTHVSKHV